MNIIQDPDKRLHTVSISVDNLNEAKTIAGKLVKVTQKVDRPWKLWLGMAAPQIGHNKRIFILKKSFYKYTVIVNPEILEQKWLLPLICKCYSLKGKFYFTRYHFWFKIRYQDLAGKYYTETIWGGNAAVIQQEMDHIDGIMLSGKGKRIL